MTGQTMTALVKSRPGPGGLALREVPVPVPAPDQLLVRVKGCAICGTDVHIQYDEYLNDPPVTLGHEFWGEVVAVGNAVSQFAVGDHVTAMSATSTCGHCQACRSGFPMRCEQRRSLGSRFNGAMAEYLVIAENICFRIPAGHEDDVSMAICEPLSCGTHMVFEQSRIQAGDVVVVIGPGPLGLGAIQQAKLFGSIVIAAGTPADTERLELAERLGADAVVSHPESLEGIVRTFSSCGADVVLECSGSAAALSNGIKICKRGGQISQLGLFGKDIVTEIDQIITKEISLVGCMGTTPFSWNKLLALIEQEKIHCKELVSAVLPLSEWEKGFRMSRAHEGYRIVLRPGE